MKHCSEQDVVAIHVVLLGITCLYDMLPGNALSRRTDLRKGRCSGLISYMLSALPMSSCGLTCNALVCRALCP